MIGFKVFDSELKCNGFQYEVGKTYTIDGKMEMCINGFHFCKNLVDCYSYKEFDKANRICIIDALGIVEEERDKCVTDKIHILKEITWNEMLSIVNFGNHNIGYKNIGNYNIGNNNIGNYNIGNNNIGNYNTGSRCVGSFNTASDIHGYFNTKYCGEFQLFNKPCKKEDFEKLMLPRFMTESKLPLSKITLDHYYCLIALPNFDINIFNEIMKTNYNEHEFVIGTLLANACPSPNDDSLEKPKSIKMEELDGILNDVPDESDLIVIVVNPKYRSKLNKYLENLGFINNDSYHKDGYRKKDMETYPIWIISTEESYRYRRSCYIIK